MKKRLWSLRWRTLTRMGFTVPAASVHERWRVVNEFSKHPAVLVILGFAFTGLLGKWFTSALDEKQRERDAIVKSMDDLRASVDDVSFSFEGYYFHTLRLIRLMERKAPIAEITAERTAYEIAEEQWQRRLAVDTSNILQRYQSAQDSVGITGVMGNMGVATSWIDTCLEQGSLEPLLRPIGPQTHRLICTDFHESDQMIADERATNLSICIREFTRLTRPDPKNDFDGPIISAASKQKAEEREWRVCNQQILKGYYSWNGL